MTNPNANTLQRLENSIRFIEKQIEMKKKNGKTDEVATLEKWLDEMYEEKKLGNLK